MKQSLSIEKTLANLFIAIMSLCIVFTVAELSAWVYINKIMNEEQFMRYASFKQFSKRYPNARQSEQWSPHRYLGYYPTPNYVKDKNRHNSLGFRGEEIKVEKDPGTVRIVCLGGSTTYSAVKDYKQSYPYLLEKELREALPSNKIEVVNAGVVSYNSWESLINLQFRVLQLKPDIIIYDAINDIHSRIVWPHSAYLPDNSGERKANANNIRVPHIVEFSNFCRLILNKLNIIQPQNSVEFKVVERPNTFYMELFMEQYFKHTYPSDIFKEVPVQRMLNENRPVYFESNIRSMIAIAKANNIKPVILTFAHSAKFPGDPMVSSPEYLQGFTEHNAILRSCQDSSYVFDFEKAMPDERAYYTDGRHFTAEGNAVRVRLIAKYLLESRILSGN